MKKKSLGLLVALLLVVGAGVYTYARYQSTFGGTGTADVAKWAVEVTGADTQSNEFDLTLTPSSSDYVATGKIAPGVGASGTIELNLTGTEVDTDIIVTIDDSTLEGATLKSVTADNGVTLTKTQDSNEYTGTITHEAIATDGVVTLTVEVEWTNSDSNNAADTEIGETDDNLQLGVTVIAKQHIG